MSEIDFSKVGKCTDKDITNAKQLVEDNLKLLTEINIKEHFDFDGAAKTTISFTYLTSRDRE